MEVDLNCVTMMLCGGSVQAGQVAPLSKGYGAYPEAFMLPQGHAEHSKGQDVVAWIVAITLHLVL